MAELPEGVEERAVKALARANWTNAQDKARREGRRLGVEFEENRKGYEDGARQILSMAAPALPTILAAERERLRGVAEAWERRARDMADERAGVDDGPSREAMEILDNCAGTLRAVLNSTKGTDYTEESGS